jgi:hypothetical protein
MTEQEKTICNIKIPKEVLNELKTNTENATDGCGCGCALFIIVQVDP